MFIYHYDDNQVYCPRDSYRNLWTLVTPGASQIIAEHNIKIIFLNLQVESYMAENQHWLTQLKEMQREHLELRSRLTEQKTLHLKQMTEKDNHIDQLRSVVNNLKVKFI